MPGADAPALYTRGPGDAGGAAWLGSGATDPGEARGSARPEGQSTSSRCKRVDDRSRKPRKRKGAFTEALASTAAQAIHNQHPFFTTTLTLQSNHG